MIVIANSGSTNTSCIISENRSVIDGVKTEGLNSNFSSYLDEGGGALLSPPLSLMTISSVFVPVS